MFCLLKVTLSISEYKLSVGTLSRKKAAWLILRHRAKLISINRSTFVAMKGTFIDWAFFCDFKGVFSVNLFVRFDCVLIFAWILNKRTGLDIACRTKLTQRNLRLSKLQKTA